VIEEVSIAKHKYTTSRLEVYDTSQLCLVMKARRQAIVLEIVGAKLRARNNCARGRRRGVTTQATLADIRDLGSSAVDGRVSAAGRRAAIRRAPVSPLRHGRCASGVACVQQYRGAHGPVAARARHDRAKLDQMVGTLAGDDTIRDFAGRAARQGS
jgi:hypothetical protein